MQRQYANGRIPRINNSNNNYTTMSLIGKGSFGSVYLVKHNTTKQTYACKKMKIYFRQSYDKQAIINELKVLACHKSKYIIKLEDAYVYNNHIHLVTEYAERGDMSKMLKRLKSRSRYILEDTIKKYLFQICLGTQYLHNNNVIHRDIKTANIFLTKDNDIKLGDVGIIKILKTTNNYAYTNIGTPFYMSPELYKNRRYTNKTDIWSIGVVLYELMTFKVPYNAENLAALKYKVSNQKWLLDDKFKQRYSKELVNLLYKILEPIPYNRYDINQILESPYFKAEYELIKRDSVKPFSKKFFSNANIPISNNDWNKVIEKYVHCPSEESLKLPEIKKPDIAKPIAHKPLEYKPSHYNPNECKPLGVKAGGYKTKALKLIDKMDKLMIYLAEANFKKYNILKTEIKTELTDYRRKYSKY